MTTVDKIRSALENKTNFRERNHTEVMNSSIQLGGNGIIFSQGNQDDLIKYKLLFENNPDAIYAINSEGFFFHLNPACGQLTGYTNEELLNMKFIQLISLQDLSRATAHFYQAMAGNTQNFDCKIIHKDGHEIDLSITNIPFVSNHEIVGVYGFARDISEIKKRKQKLRESEELHRILIENSTDVLAKTDVDGNFLYVSPVCKKLLGYEPEELIGRSYLDFIFSEDLAAAIKNSYLLKIQGFSEITCRLCRKDGSTIPMEIIHNTFQTLKGANEVVSVFRDMTVKVKAEAERRHREEIYQNLVEQSPDAVLITKKGKILFINDTGVQLFGGSSKEVFINRAVFDFLAPEERDIAKHQFYSNGQDREFTEQTFTGFDGRTFIAEVKGIPTIFQNESAIHFIIRDISEKKKTQQLFLRSEKLSAAGQLAAGIAHEIRNPLTAIKGFLQLLQVEPVQNSYVEIVNSEINRIELILSELLLLAKPQNADFSKRNLGTILQKVKALIHAQSIIHNVEIKVEVLSDLPEIYCDENQLKQVFINLIKNSIEAMPNGGNIHILINKMEENVLIIFKDNGCGIPEELLQRLGEPFFTTKPNGTGLGFLVSKQIIKNHQGTIRARSNEQGTTIEILLPISRERNE